MDFNLNEFLKAIANTLDTIEMDIFGIPTNHSKRIAYLSVLIAKELNLRDEEIFDLASLAIMHDNGASLKILHDNISGSTKEKLDIVESRKEHCIIGEENLKDFPFLTSPIDVILYHHEKYNGTGFFGRTAQEIPLFAQIIALADTLDLTFDLREGPQTKGKKEAFVHDHRDTFFSSILTNAFLKVSEHTELWNGLKDTNIDSSLSQVVPQFSNAMNYEDIRQLTKTLSKIIDAKSKYTHEHSAGLSVKIATMADFYHIDFTTTNKLLIASDLHDLGKLIISNDILDRPGRLTEEEYNNIKRHPAIARSCLENVSGFEDISRWVGNHHEKLNGSGYPNGLIAEDLDFYSKLLTSMDVYQALTEERPYRSSMDHWNAMRVMQKMVDLGELDSQIVQDIDFVYRKHNTDHHLIISDTF